MMVSHAHYVNDQWKLNCTNVMTIMSSLTCDNKHLYMITYSERRWHKLCKQLKWNSYEFQGSKLNQHSFVNHILWKYRDTLLFTQKKVIIYTEDLYIKSCFMKNWSTLSDFMLKMRKNICQRGKKYKINLKFNFNFFFCFVCVSKLSVNSLSFAIFSETRLISCSFASQVSVAWLRNV